jgi:hypothetical protein
MIDPLVTGSGSEAGLQPSRHGREGRARTGYMVLPLDSFAVLAPLDNFTFRARLAEL